jgi:hypothetical protein
MEDVRRRGQADVLPQIEVISLHESIEAPAAEFPREAQVLELRFFGGYEMSEVAEIGSVSEHRGKGFPVRTELAAHFPLFGCAS